VKDEEDKQSRASGLFERLWVSSIREEDSRAKRRLAVLERFDVKDSIREEDSRAKRRLAVLERIDVKDSIREEDSRTK
jgi:hypothetical protein